jgi:hypothetical protein
MDTVMFDQDLTWDKCQNTWQYRDAKIEELRQRQIERAAKNKPRL